MNEDKISASFCHKLTQHINEFINNPNLDNFQYLGDHYMSKKKSTKFWNP